MNVENPIENIQLPFVMEAKTQNKVLAAFVLPVGILLSSLVIYSFAGSVIAKFDWGPMIVMLLFGSFGVFLCVYPALAITRITCTEEGIEFSALFFTYKRIAWKDITKVTMQTINASVVFNPLLAMSEAGKIKTINIHYKGAFLGFASAINFKNYRWEDLSVFQNLLHQHLDGGNAKYDSAVDETLLKEKNKTRPGKWASCYFYTVLLLGIFCVIIEPKPLTARILMALPVLNIILFVLAQAIFKPKALSDLFDQKHFRLTVMSFGVPMVGLYFLAKSYSGILDWKPFWIMFVLLTLLELILALLFFPSARRINANLLLALIFLCPYNWAVIITSNCLLDKSVPAVFQPKVLNHRIGRQYYYVTLSPGGPIPERTEFNVNQRFYQGHPVGSPVTVTRKSGFLHMPWYEINDRWKRIW